MKEEGEISGVSSESKVPEEADLYGFKMGSVIPTQKSQYFNLLYVSEKVLLL